MTTVLESDYKEPDRPYSLNELLDMTTNTHKMARLGKVFAQHQLECNHFYLVRENGRKEKKILECGADPGNCSVCWRLSKTANRYQGRATALVSEYMATFSNDVLPEDLTHSIVDLEHSFYKWLYMESN